MNLFLLHGEQIAAANLIAVAWQAGLLSVATAAVLRLMPRLSAASRFTAWAAVFLILLLLPFAPHVHADASTHSLQLDARWSLALAVLWASLSLERALQLARAFLRLRTLSQRAVPLQLSTMADARNAQLCLSPDVLGPSVIGFFRPRILIPDSLYARLTAAELQHILLHERQHLRRRDDWLNLLQKIGLVLFPLNPALLWVERRLCFERELACDESVLAATNAPQSYARSLVSLAEHALLGRRLSLALGAWERRSELSRRIHRILAARPQALTSRAASAVLTVLCAGLLVSAAVLTRAPRLVSFADPAPASLASAANVLPVAQPALTGHRYSSQVTAQRTSQLSLVPAMLTSEPAPRSSSLRAHRTLARPRRTPAPRNLLASYAAPSHTQVEPRPTQTFNPQYRTVSDRSVANRGRIDHNRVAWSETSFSSIEATPTILFAVFDSSTGSPSYAAIPTPRGWLVFQL